MNMEKVKKIILALGAAYCMYGLFLLVTLGCAIVYDYVNGGNEAFHWVYEMQTTDYLSTL